MTTNNVKESFAVAAKHGAFYTGGNIEWSSSGENLFCHNGSTVSILSLTTGLITGQLGVSEDQELEDTINSFTVSNDNNHAVTHHKSGLFKLWTLKDAKLTKLWKAIHKGPVSQIALFGDNLMMASGGSDSSVRLWDLQHNSCTLNLKGVQGVVSVLKFHPDAKKELIFAAGDNMHICAWNTQTGQIKFSLAGHFSRVTSLSFHEDGVHLVSSGRDKVLILWDITTGKSIRTVPVYEGIEGTFILPTDAELPVEFDANGIVVASAGEKGSVKLWEMKSGRSIYCQENSLVPTASEEGGLAITRLEFNQKLQSFAVVSADHNILIHTLKNFNCTKQFIGYSDEIFDMVYVGENGTHLAVATNSSDIKLYELTTMSCQLLRGHTDLVLALSATPSNCNLMISSGKDKSVRIWLMDKLSKKMACIGSATRHTASVGSVAVSQVSSSFFASVSQDMCLKLWSLPDKLKAGDELIKLTVAHTVLAHQKDINCVTVSPNDKIIATASQDKTAKIWDAEKLQLLGVFKGHRRGIWCVRFSPIDQVLLTTSADCTMKLWSLSELNCLKTFEGHESSVLRAEFLTRGMQLITSGADGLIKLWCVKTSECIKTMEEHESRVLALAVNKNEKNIVSGGSDSTIIVWRDVTVENREKAEAERDQLILEEQKLANLLQADELLEALKLSLKLEKPKQVLRILEDIVRRNSEGLSNAIAQLESYQSEALLNCVLTWNTNSRNAHISQLVIKILLNAVGSGQLTISNLPSVLEGLIPYTDRHYKRLTGLLQDLHLLNYTVSRMKPHNDRILVDNDDK